MSEHLSEEQSKKYSEKRLEPKDLLQVDEHLAVCEDCRSRLSVNSKAIIKSFQQEFADQQPEQHLTYDQLAGYLEKKPETDRLLVENHRKICSRCDRDYEDLKAFSQEHFFTGRRTIHPAIGVAAILAVIALVATLTFRDTGDQQSQQPIPDAAVVISINDKGTPVTLDENGKLSGLNRAPANYQEMVRLALQTQQVEISDSIDSLITKGGVVRGEPREGIPFQLVKPVGTVVESDRPLFQWERLEGASKYRITLLDINMNSAVDSGWLTDLSWTPDRPLQRDTTYIWQVAASRNDEEVLSPQPPAGEARFRVMNRQTQEQLNQERNRYSNSDLLLGLLYARHGLLDDAEHEFQLLAEANPHSQEIKQLLQTLQKLRS